jgi:hypothetical protein
MTKYNIREYGAGAFLYKDDEIIADFNSHLDAEEVIRLIEIGQRCEAPYWDVDDLYLEEKTEIYIGDEPEDWSKGVLIFPPSRN